MFCEKNPRQQTVLLEFEIGLALEWKSNQFEVSEPKSDSSLTIVNFNIEYGDQMERALFEFKNYDELRKADIIFLQEMDESGVQYLSDSLEYNYIYFPISKNKDSQNFGNAILSKSPIRSEQKLILPHAKSGNQRRRDSENLRGCDNQYG